MEADGGETDEDGADEPLHISEPRDFKRGVHITVDVETGRLTGVPDAWKNAVCVTPHCRSLNGRTDFVNPDALAWKRLRSVYCRPSMST